MGRFSDGLSWSYICVQPTKSDEWFQTDFCIFVCNEKGQSFYAIKRRIEREASGGFGDFFPMAAKFSSVEWFLQSVMIDPDPKITWSVWKNPYIMLAKGPQTYPDGKNHENIDPLLSAEKKSTS